MNKNELKFIKTAELDGSKVQNLSQFCLQKLVTVFRDNLQNGVSLLLT